MMKTRFNLACLSYILFFILYITAVPLTAQESSDGFALDIGRYSISITPKILQNGVQNDTSFGLFYTESKMIAGEIRLRSINEALSDTVWGIDDSLLTRESRVFELFFLPVSYYFIRTDYFSLKAGTGVYYENNKQKENGFFNDRDFNESSGEDVYNSYINDYLGHSIGPLVDIGINYKYAFFKSALSFGIVPVFYLSRNQSWKLHPFMSPVPSYTAAGESICGPYYYLSLDISFDIKFFTILLTLLNEYSIINYLGIGFNNDTGEWADVKEKIEYKKFAFEISVLINLGLSGIKPQIGYGRTFDEITGGANYLLLGVKKDWF